ncbi:MAG: hypothetical protein KTR15_08410 [Phycisphaeraceae bacterium]|nr:hypothetical protein [Phycisphaeraceae bacterium]
MMKTMFGWVPLALATNVQHAQTMTNKHLVIITLCVDIMQLVVWICHSQAINN